MRRDLAGLFVVLVVTCGCPKAPRPSARDGAALATFADGSARLALTRAHVPPAARPGQRVDGSLTWEVRGDCAGTVPAAFVHLDAPGSELRQAQGDHPLTPNNRSATEWKVGDVLADSFSVVVPPTLGVDTLDVYVGIYEGKRRWTATTNLDARDDRVKIGTIHVDGAPPLAPAGRARHLSADEKIVIDGVLDEPAWQRAQALGPFVGYDGKSRVELPTSARVLWDDAALYLAFNAVDPDPFTPYTKRDDPLYESEALEIFIDADGDKDVYVELQSAPNDLHFDAAFAGGRRQNMDRAYDVDFTTKTVTDPARRLLTQEWRIPIAALKDVPAGEPRAGSEWRINLFRLERVRDADKQKVLRTEASAWCAPLSGDFHNLDRFCALKFE